MSPELDLPLLFAALGAVGVLVTAIATVAKLYLLPWRERKRKRRLAERQTLTNKKSSLDTLIRQIEKNIEESVKPNKFPVGANIGWYIPEFKKKIKEYHKEYDRCKDWLEACKVAIEHHMMLVTSKKFPNTVEEYKLHESLQADEFVNMYIEGEKITLTFIKENYPSLHKDIIEHLKEKRAQHKLDVFFLEINDFFKNHVILKRFRQEKKELIEFGHQLIKELKKEIILVDKEILKFSDIEEQEELMGM